MKILLIAGHGQGDPGACYKNFQEAAIARDLAAVLAKQLSPYAETVVFDTARNMYQYLKTHTFNFKGYDYVLEIHFNSSANALPCDGKTTGTEILVHTTQQDKTVETKILDNICALGFTNRGVKTTAGLLNANVCKGKQGVRYALLETCFINDVNDMDLYAAKKSQVVSAIAKGILESFGIAYPNRGNKLLESANDIVWELNHSYFPITETDNFVKALALAKQTGSPLYWGYYKLVNKIN